MTRFACFLLGVVCCGLPARAGELREVKVSLHVPDSAWALTIEEVVEVKQTLWVVARVSRDADAIGLQVLTTRKASVQVPASSLPLKVYVIGKTWAWENKEPYTFIQARKQIERELASGTRRFKREPPGPRKP